MVEFTVSALILSFVWVVCSTSPGIHIKEADLGKDVVLDCRGSSSNINLVVWNRPDLGPEEYVFFLEGDTASRSNQLPSYRGRVSLLDPQMKNGDVSVLLKNVTISDNGTYECLTLETNTGRSKRAAGPYDPQSRNKIQLTVRTLKTEHPQTGSGGPSGGSSPETGALHGHTGLLVVVVLMVVVLSVSGVVWKRSTKKRAEQPAV